MMSLRSALIEPVRLPSVGAELVQAPAQPALAQLLTRFRPISLDQMDAVALQNRTDTKYVLSSAQFYQALRVLAGQYRVLEIDGARLNAYQTLYFDTSDFMLYLQHHAGKGNRYKVRSRRYVGSDLSFFELKLKINKDRTIKQRFPTDGLATACTPEMSAFLAAHLPGQAPTLRPVLWNSFSRATLVSYAARERVTIDMNLRFRAESRIAALPGIAIVEVKQDGVDRGSGFIQQLHAAQIRPTGFSKYCIGVALLYPHIKHNRFKPTLRLINSLLGGTHYDN